MSNPQHRVLAIDFGRGASVFVMMLVHTLVMYGRPELQMSSGFGEPIQIAGRGTAMFLVAMGFSFALSDKSALSAVVRGAQLFVLGYAMNALLFLVPYFGAFMPESFVRIYGFEPPIRLEQVLSLLLTADVLQLAGISFALMALLKPWLERPRNVLALAFAVAFISAELRGARAGIGAVDYACDLLWGAEYDVYFPVFPWFAVILYGLYLGRLYQSFARDAERLDRAMLRLGVPLALGGYLLCQIDSDYHYRDFYHGGFGSTLASMGIASLLFCLAHRLTPFFLRHRVGTVLQRASRRVTELYVLSWVVLCWGMGLFGFQAHGELAVFVLALWVMAMALASDWLLERSMERLGQRPLLASRA